MVQDYLETGEGLLGTLQEGPQAFIVSARAKAEGQQEWPDIQLNFNPMAPIPSGEDLPTSAIYAWNVRPKLNGSLEMNTTAYREGSRDDMKLALIDFNIFEGQSSSDVEVLMESW